MAQWDRRLILSHYNIAKTLHLCRQISQSSYRCAVLSSLQTVWRMVPVSKVLEMSRVVGGIRARRKLYASMTWYWSVKITIRYNSSWAMKKPLSLKRKAHLRSSTCSHLLSSDDVYASKSTMRVRRMATGPKPEATKVHPNAKLPNFQSTKS